MFEETQNFEKNGSLLEPNQEAVTTVDEEIDLGDFFGADSDIDPFADDEAVLEPTDTAPTESNPASAETKLETEVPVSEVVEEKTEKEKVMINDGIVKDKPVEQPAQLSEKSTADVPQNPFEAAVKQAEEIQAKGTKIGLISKLPVFDYGGVTEEIVDISKTFEEIRKEKVADFPELDDEKRVSWKMVYGKITKPVSSPKEKTVAKMKSEIENSKEFIDALKKSKDDIVCKVTPTVTAQKKGEMPAYKGVYTTLEDAAQSNKPIVLVPSDDGNVYEIRSNQIGRFRAKAKNTSGLSKVRAGFSPALPPLPYCQLAQIIAFFRHYSEMGIGFEALANVYWDMTLKQYHVYVPMQKVSKESVDTHVPDIDAERFVHVMDIHSHNTMPAKFSQTDDDDEKATRIYAVIGRLDQPFPEIKVRVAVGGSHVIIDPALVFDFPKEEYPENWTKAVKLYEPDRKDVSLL